MTPHKFRRTVATTINESGGIELASQLLGHTDPAISITDAIPDALDIAIPRGMRVPMTEGAVQWHRFDAATFDLGRDEV